MSAKTYDVIVVGGGHAGCEAALAAARMGAATALVTMRRADIACMPCNPAIGGIAKSHLVFELDALGGEMAVNADMTGIQFRVLNMSRGPAVRSNRVQCDKVRYSDRMRCVLERTPGLDVLEARVIDIHVEGGCVRGVVTEGLGRLAGRSVVLTPGTFLRGRIHVGDRSHPGGRDDAESSDGLSDRLTQFGFRLARLKTGTPPRLHRDTVDFSSLDRQPGTEPAPFFSCAVRRWHRVFHVEHRPVSDPRGGSMFHVEHPGPRLEPWPPGSDQVACHLTHTAPETHAIIRANLLRSSLYGGRISGTGVRYCPSVEDKIVKFPDKESHHVFLEPEGRETPLVYPNGLSNSLPVEVQQELIHSIPGLEDARIEKPGYAIEYDFADPTQLDYTLQSRLVENLYLAGQINGTTGYEEAAAQGFVGGVNAARKVSGRGPFVLKRTEAYIGVLVDDLVTKGTDEPYRMFTSRAERRLILRQDNARFRMLPHAVELGILGRELLDETTSMDEEVGREISRLERERTGGVTLAQMLRRPETHYAQLPTANAQLAPETVRQIEIRVKYQGYIDREQLKVAQSESIEGLAIPAGIDYASIEALRVEAREKLSRVRPDNLGQASRVPGINPADISVLSVLISRGL